MCPCGVSMCPWASRYARGRLDVPCGVSPRTFPGSARWALSRPQPERVSRSTGGALRSDFPGHPGWNASCVCVKTRFGQRQVYRGPRLIAKTMKTCREQALGTHLDLGPGSPSEMWCRHRIRHQDRRCRIPGDARGEAHRQWGSPQTGLVVLPRG